MALADRRGGYPGGLPASETAPPASVPSAALGAGRDPASATVADVERAIMRRLLTTGAAGDPVSAVMSVVGPVIVAKDQLIARLRRGHA